LRKTQNGITVNTMSDFNDTPTFILLDAIKVLTYLAKKQNDESIMQAASLLLDRLDAITE